MGEQEENTVHARVAHLVGRKWKKAKRAEPEHSEHDTSPRWTGGRAVVERERRRRRRFLVLGGLSGMVAVAVAAVVCSRGR